MAADGDATVILCDLHLDDIPKEVLEKCNIVVILDLSKNPRIHLEGVLSQFTNLRRLVLRHGGFRPVPNDISVLTKLEELDLSGNQFFTDLNPALGQLRMLKKLNLRRACLPCIPDWLGDLQQLTELNLADNLFFHITDLNPALRRLRMLKKLNLRRAGLRRIPDWLEDLQQLKDLNLAKNNLSTADISALGRLRMLKKLNLNYDDLESIPEWLGDLQQLKELNLAQNPLSTSDIAALGRLRMLKKLNLNYDDLESIPEWLGDLQQLKELNLAVNNLRTADISALGRLRMLRKLNLKNVHLESIPECLGDLQQLKELNLAQNPLSTSDIAALGRLRMLKKLNLKYINLESIPECLGDLQQLEELNLTGNSFSTDLNPALGRLRMLKKLNLSRANLQSIPEWFGDLQQLEELNLAGNSFSTDLNPALGRMRMLKKLNLRRTNLQSIPEWLGDLQQLAVLNLSGNNLKEYPRCLLSMENLTKLDLSNRSFDHLEYVSDSDVLDVYGDDYDDDDGYDYDYDVDDDGDYYDDDDSDDYDDDDDDNRSDEKEDDDESVSGGDAKASPSKQQKGTFCNCIRKLPTELATTRLKKLKLARNPITFPPKAIWKQGLEAIKSYMREIEKGQKVIRSDTINMIGESEAGKTSIALSLTEGKPCLADFDDRTQVVQQLELAVDATFRVSINDFGGHPIYHSVIPIFLSSSGLTILACSMEKCETALEDEVEDWLQMAFVKSAEIRVIVCGTHTDCMANDEQCLTIKQKIEGVAPRVQRRLSADVTLQINELSKLDEKEFFVQKMKMLEELDHLKKRVAIAQYHVTTVTCKNDDGSLHELRRLVLEKLQRRLDKMPEHWWRVMNDILNYNKTLSRDKAEALPYLTMNELKENIYKKHINNDPSCQRLPIILKYLVASSQIIWLENDRNLSDVIFISPHRMVEICKQVLDHNQTSVFVKKCANNYRGSMDAQQLQNYLDEYSRGILKVDFLKRLLSSEQDADYLNKCVHFLQHFNLLTEIRPSQNAPNYEREFVIPSNLPVDAPATLPYVENKLRDCEVRVSVTLSFLGGLVPKSFFETSLSLILTAANKMSEDGPTTGQWRNGLYICHNEIYCIVRRLNEKRRQGETNCLGKDVTEQRIIVIAGSKYERNLWSVLLPVLECFQANTRCFWPGAPLQFIIPCPACSYVMEHSAENVQEAKYEKSTTAKKPLYYLKRSWSSKPTNPHCPRCSESVPRSLCFPITKDSLLQEKNDIETFLMKYRPVEPNFDATPQGGAFLLVFADPAGEEEGQDLAGRKRRGDGASNSASAPKRRNSATIGSLRELEDTEETSANSRLSNMLDIDVLDKFKLNSEKSVERLTKEETQKIAALLCAADLLLPSEKEAVDLNMNTPTDAARYLVNIVVKKARIEKTRKFLDILENELGRTDLMDLLLS